MYVRPPTSTHCFAIKPSFGGGGEGGEAETGESASRGRSPFSILAPLFPCAGCRRDLCVSWLASCTTISSATAYALSESRQPTEETTIPGSSPHTAVDFYRSFTGLRGCSLAQPIGSSGVVERATERNCGSHEIAKRRVAPN